MTPTTAITVPPIAIGSRPRTLLLAVSADEIEAAILGPTGTELGADLRMAPSDSVDALWPQLEPLGEFDRITVTIRRSAEEGWDAGAWIRELERQSLRPVRRADAPVLWRHVIRGEGVELVLVLGPELESVLYLDGIHVPGLMLGRHRFRKGRTYQEYLAPRVLERKGARGWNRRLTRAVTEILSVWNPSTLYVTGPEIAPIDLAHLAPKVVVVPRGPRLEAAVALWRAT